MPKNVCSVPIVRILYSRRKHLTVLQIWENKDQETSTYIGQDSHKSKCCLKGLELNFNCSSVLLRDTNNNYTKPVNVARCLGNGKQFYTFLFLYYSCSTAKVVLAHNNSFVCLRVL